MGSLVASALNKRKQTDWFLSACHDKLGFNSTCSSAVAFWLHVYVKLLWFSVETAVLCVCTSTDLDS